MVSCLGSLFSPAVGREEHCKQISLVCVGSAHSVLATLGLPLLTWCVLSQSTLLRFQVALQGTGPVLRALPRSKPLRFRFSTKAQTRLGLRFVPFPGPRSSGNQALGKCTTPGGVVHLITSPVAAAWFPGFATGVPSQVCCVSPLGS